MIHRILLTTFVAIVTMAYGGNNETVPLKSIPDELKKLNVFLKPILDVVIQDQIPRSIGLCETDAPKPCQEMGILLQMEKFRLKAEAYWLGGLDTLKLEELVIDSLNPNYVGVYVEVSVQELPLKMKVDFCGHFNWKCRTLLHDTETCCGNSPKRLSALLRLPCSVQAPYFGEPIMEYVNILPDITLKPWGKISLVHVTSAIQNMIESQYKSLMTPEILDLVNKYLGAALGPGPFTCASLKY